MIKYDNWPLETAGEYLEGTVYSGVAAAEESIGAAYRSLQAIVRRPGDSDIQFYEATLGMDARQWHTEKFLASSHSWMWYLDGDMKFEPDCLERLRSHGLPCVTGLAFRRTFEPSVMPAWCEDDPEFQWPMVPFRQTPEQNRMYRLGATGFYCWLIHRSVFEAVAPLLKGERYVMVDDMDVWPYDLKEVLAGREKLRVLRGRKDTVGADYRLSYFIRRAGFTIWGDGSVRVGHYINYPIGIRDWEGYGQAYRQQFADVTDRDLTRLREEHLAETREVRTAEQIRYDTELVREHSLQDYEGVHRRAVTMREVTRGR